MRYLYYKIIAKLFSKLPKTFQYGAVTEYIVKYPNEREFLKKVIDFQNSIDNIKKIQYNKYRKRGKIKWRMRMLIRVTP